MAEDSGAFKTKRANSRQIPAYYHDAGVPLQGSLTGHENVFRTAAGGSRRRFLASAANPLRYSQIT
jgi:hypothetical protein